MHAEEKYELEIMVRGAGEPFVLVSQSHEYELAKTEWLKARANKDVTRAELRRVTTVQLSLMTRA